MGEAENQGLKGMTAVAEAIRNRGTLKGVYGVKSPRLKKAPKWVFAMASKAWDDSQKSNLVKNANGWGTDADIEKFKSEGWWNDSLIVTRIGDHTFYKGKVSK